jgi:hypothetical protein
MKSEKYIKVFAVVIISLFLLSGVIQFTVNQNSPSGTDAKPATLANYIPITSRGNKQSGQVVSVNSLYSAEPAPMGIADYGIGTGGISYNYSTTSFLGHVDIKNLRTYNSSLNASSTEMTFQLNINFVFYDGSKEYVYWVQNVADFNTSSTPSVGFIDNVWNISAPSASVYNSTLSGNGTVGNSSGTFFYYSFANQSLPGNDIYVSYPFNMEMAINYTSTSHGIPELEFMYNDGHGWQTYDNVLFNFATNVTKISGFVVNGFNYEPNGYSFYDAELILGGPGDGTQTNDTNSSVALQLDYFNGHNYQMITNAYNFGSDTAEGIRNVTSNAQYYLSNGSLFASITSGLGKLEQIYNRSAIALLNISAPGTSGYVVVSGTRYNFVGGDANLTLAAGTYNVKVYNSKSSLILQKNETLTAGSYVFLSTVSTYKVTFLSSGLPAGTTWYLNLSNGRSLHTNASRISTNLTNGNYTYNATASDTYRATGNFSVSGANVTVNVAFKMLLPKTYQIEFVETGLSSGTTWNVTLNGSLKTSSSSSLIFEETNGSYSYTVGAVIGFTASPGSGVVTVPGSNESISVDFTPNIIVSKYNVTFVETGLVGVTWFVNLTDGHSAYSTSNTITFLLPNGTYEYSISSASSLFEPTPALGTFIVNGASQQKNVIFSGAPLSLTFEESGLPSGTSWSVTLNGTTETSTNSSITFLILTGTYEYYVTPPVGYTTAQNNGTVKLVTPSEVVQVTFTLVKYSITFTASGLPSGTIWAVTFNGTPKSSSSDSIMFSAINGSYSFAVSNVTGYTVAPSNGNVLVDGASLTETIVFSQIITVGYFTGSVTPANASIYVNGQTYAQTDGHFNISLPPGTYEVKVSAPGYSTYTENITVTSSIATQLTALSLEKTSTPTQTSPITDVVIVVIVVVVVLLLAGVGLAMRSRRKK